MIEVGCMSDTNIGIVMFISILAGGLIYAILYGDDNE